MIKISFTMHNRKLKENDYKTSGLLTCLWVRKNSIKTENQMKNENQLLIKVVFITTLIFILSLLENIYEQTHTHTRKHARTKYLQLLLEFSLLFLLMIYTIRNKSFCQQDIERRQTEIRLIYRQIMK